MRNLLTRAKARELKGLKCPGCGEMISVNVTDWGLCECGDFKVIVVDDRKGAHLSVQPTFIKDLFKFSPETGERLCLLCLSHPVAGQGVGGFSGSLFCSLKCEMGHCRVVIGKFYQKETGDGDKVIRRAVGAGG